MPRYQWVRVGVKGLIARGNRLLLLHRRRDLALLPDLWDLPGGGVEVGDGLEYSLVREVREETGFTVRVGRPVHAWIVRSRLTSGRYIPGIIVCYACSTRATRDPRLDATEHSEFAWVSREQMERYRIAPDQRAAIRKAFTAR